jgi:hypothetical protein
MYGDDLDRMLSSDEEIVPSSGFACSVMETIRQSHAAPPPIPFPWRRVVPGVVLMGALLVVFMLWFPHSPAAGGWSPTGSALAGLPAWLPDLEHTLVHVGIGWIALALVLAYIPWKVSMTLAVGQQ